MFLKRLFQLIYRIEKQTPQAIEEFKQLEDTLQTLTQIIQDDKDSENFKEFAEAFLAWAKAVNKRLGIEESIPENPDNSSAKPSEQEKAEETPETPKTEDSSQEPPAETDKEENKDELTPDAPETSTTGKEEIKEESKTEASDNSDSLKDTIGDWLQVDLSTTSGDTNKKLLQEALNTGRNVKIKHSGTYPLTPSVLIKSQTLDLNFSAIRINARKHKGGLFYLSGNNPILIRGEICGSFDEPSAPLNDSNFFEGESLVSPYSYAYSNAEIHNLKLHHCWGYAVAERTDEQIASLLGLPAGQTNMAARCYVYLDTSGAKKESSSGYLGGQLLPTSEGYLYRTEKLDLTENLSSMPQKMRGPSRKYKYIDASNGLGYFRIISDRPIEYEFTLSSGQTYRTSQLQGKAVEIPEGAVGVSVTTYCKSKDAGNWGIGLDKRVGYVIYLTNEVGGLTVTDCAMRFNSSLGMCGTSLGPTYVKNCQSYGNGRPDADSKPSHTTVGFIDIEDNPTCYVSLENITSDLETNGAMLGAVSAYVNNWKGSTITIYRGLGATVENSDAYIGLFSDDTPTPLLIKNSIIRGQTSNKLPPQVTTANCTFYNCPVRTSGDTYGTYIYSNSYTSAGNALTQKAIAHINTAGGLTADGFSPLEASDLSLTINGSADTPLGKWRPIIATGDCYDISVDDTIYPNGHTVAYTKFTPGKYKHPYRTDTMFGIFSNCVFNLDKREFCTVGFHMYDKTIEFDSCVIHNAKNPLFGRNGTTAFGVGKGVKLIFKSCVIDNKNNICVTRANTPGIATAGLPTIEFVDCTFTADV